jgi:hypothetical protein
MNPPNTASTIGDNKTMSNQSSYRQSISPSHNFIKKKRKSKMKEFDLVSQSMNKIKLPTINPGDSSKSPRDSGSVII